MLTETATYGLKSRTEPRGAFFGASPSPNRVRFVRSVLDVILTNREADLTRRIAAVENLILKWRTA